MKKYALIALTKAVGDRQDEFVKWYDEQHIPDTLRIDGIVAAQRYVMEGSPKGAKVPSWEVMVIYDVETDDIKRTFAALAAAMNTPAMPMSDALDTSTIVRILASPGAPKVHRAA